MIKSFFSPRGNARCSQTQSNPVVGSPAQLPAPATPSPLTDSEIHTSRDQDIKINGRASALHGHTVSLSCALVSLSRSALRAPRPASAGPHAPRPLLSPRAALRGVTISPRRHAYASLTNLPLNLSTSVRVAAQPDTTSTRPPAARANGRGTSPSHGARRHAGREHERATFLGAR